MAYGRFGGGGQSNLRAPDAGQERANKKDQERNVTIPKVKLPVKKKKKPVTIFGFKVTAPKTDMQKKIDSGQATVLAGRKLDSGKTLLTTEKATGKIVSKNEQDRKILVGSSVTSQGRPRTVSNVPTPVSKPKAGSSTMAVRQVDPSGTKTMTALTPRRPTAPKSGPVYKGQPLTEFKQSGQSVRLSALQSKTGGSPVARNTFKPKPSYKDVPPEIKRSDNLGGINRIDQIPKKPKPIIPEQTLLRGVGGLKSAFSGITLEQRKLLGKTSPKGGYQGAFQTSSVSFMGQNKKLAKVGDKFFRIKKDGKLAKDALSGVQNKYFRNRLNKGKSELKWSLISGVK
tara:strand:+ start:407 stop:1432 length:1026 start_codon:yes stop_codon:yes gene_type:complete